MNMELEIPKKSDCQKHSSWKMLSYSKGEPSVVLPPHPDGTATRRRCPVVDIYRVVWKAVFLKSQQLSASVTNKWKMEIA